ncbi:Hypothetical predicted protein [Paramuricea clavata]|uniref:Uncharacterized protein n=1 Tax=Paramuricea clavata TaxID=317549 RepID=A0A7D9E2L8_PARCT|nr:Hypothetical predicted protein [Paramuricea clavata]
MQFSEFQPQAIQLHYRDPVHYAEMLHIQGDLERQKLNEELRTCLRFAVQVDGSVDTKQQDKKFVFVRLNSEENPLSIQTRLVSVKQVEKRGAHGLFDAVVSSLKDVGLDDMDIKAKYSGLTTDGESANTGQKSGLWARMDEYVGHPSFNLWCACHRSDLAMEDLVASVPELTIWKANVVAVATYYRTSGLRTKELKTLFPRMKSFPAHHEVRFGQHLVQLREAVLYNLDSCRLHWQKVVDSDPRDDGYGKKEKEKAKGFLKTCFLQAFKYKDVAMQKLVLMKNKPYPGGQEEQHQKRLSGGADAESEQRRTTHSLVTTFRRGKEPIRVEVIASSENFLNTRLNDEQNEVVRQMIEIITATTAIEFINASLPLLALCNIKDQDKFLNAVLENFDSMKPGDEISAHDYGVRLYSMLRGSKPPATEFLSTFCVVSPHSMTVERSMSTYNMLFSDLRTSTSDTILIDRLLIHWNGVATALYDPRPAVQNFMLRKDRRMKLPVISTYTERDFIKKFFE